MFIDEIISYVLNICYSFQSCFINLGSNTVIYYLNKQRKTAELCKFLWSVLTQWVHERVM